MDLKEAKHTAFVVRQLEEGKPNRALDALDWALAELARVKAESLRVVADTQRGYHYMTPSGIGWNSEDKSGNPCVETPTDYHDFADCQPVRIERWEATHDNH